MSDNAPEALGFAKETNLPAIRQSIEFHGLELDEKGATWWISSKMLTVGYTPISGIARVFGQTWHVRDLNELLTRIADDSLRPKREHPKYQRSRCSSCDRPILWYRPKPGENKPIDLNGQSHFATCKNAKKHRRAK